MLSARNATCLALFLALGMLASGQISAQGTTKEDRKREAEDRKAREAKVREIREACSKPKRRYEYARATLEGRERRGASDELMDQARKEFAEAQAEYCECLKSGYEGKGLALPPEYYEICVKSGAVLQPEPRSPTPLPTFRWKPTENVGDECGLARKIYRDALRDPRIGAEEKRLRHELLCDCVKRHYPDQWRQECVRPDGTPMFVGFDRAIPPPTTATPEPRSPTPLPTVRWKPAENVNDECGLARKIYRDALRDPRIGAEEKRLRHELLCDCLKRHYPDQWRQECVRPDGTPMFVGFDRAIPPPTTGTPISKPGEPPPPPLAPPAPGTGKVGGGRARVPTPTPTSAVVPPPAPTEVSLAPCATEGASTDVVATVVRHLDNHDHTWCGQYLNRRIRAVFTQALLSTLLLNLQGLPGPLTCSVSPPGCAGTCDATFAQLAGQANVTVRLELRLRNGQVEQGRLVFGFPGQPFEVSLASP